MPEQHESYFRFALEFLLYVLRLESQYPIKIQVNKLINQNVVKVISKILLFIPPIW